MTQVESPFCLTHDVLRVEEGALYPALHRLELRGQIQQDSASRGWVESRLRLFL